VFSGILLVIVCPTTSGRIELDEHVILLFTFDRDSGKTIKDGSKKGNDGKVIGNDKLVAGKFSKAFEFDGETYIEVEKSDTLDITDQITAAAWIYRIGPSKDNDFILDKRCQGCGGGFELVVYRPEMNEAAYQTFLLKRKVPS
jgi:hypothetical protein